VQESALPPPISLPIFPVMIFQDALFWRSAGKAEDEALVRRRFWRKCRRVAARLPFAQDLLAAYYCAFDRSTPLYVKTALIGTLAYFVLPADVVPDFLPALGYADDAASLAATLRLVASHILPEHRDAAAQALARLAEEG
jgi:uncharacterized membrane protein YkvA (DUF1232 family)